ncbi:aminodeoxychorismate synthase component I [Algibacter amylolyticus]|uniref:Aminodeoxychorismate synthase component I n=1 Tax=Algibacter amylolyticus TaxID=1608400 RepID=A0A5M7AYS8_9FLAO|nr:aminodeoxychorismate synthase component I [Algibacter amylolyticus]KAA5822359.1 aminodeoxychorismate synthase component I [Algibacter amylolyticus]MBB5269077.1 para-aminobenzoate synthetase component 1 [Algibacter amylolyticus]TSJ73509.1 aminodeoxychorismate synthase component I [Algibacter amylolyticus]
MRTKQIHTFEDIEKFKTQLLNWAQQFDEVVWLDSNPNTNKNEQKHYSYDAILAVEAFTSIKTDYHQGFEKLKEYQGYTNDWIFGYLTYDLKNDTEALKSSKFDGLGFSDMCFFQPKKVFLISGNQVEIQYLNFVDDEIDDDLLAIKIRTQVARGQAYSDIKIKLRTHKDAYFEKVNTMLEHIYRGDIYEANFCQEFYAENKEINPLETYQKLNSISKPPFAAFIKLEDKYVLSASPERYLKKQGNTIISQPIKGTAKRAMNTADDNLLKTNLHKDKKERSENIMIVDLVRNDLSKTALKGSVKVEELCKIYTFQQVHHMISTITSQVDPSTHPVDIIKSTFPMGSMTGAPKLSAMKIIETLEDCKRGIYSGAIGYFTPTGDFDFNVVIRSILYNKTKKFVSYSVGGAITAKSDPLKEYEECLIKAKAMRDVLEN